MSGALILVVDDDQLVRELMVAQLTALGYRTLQAASGDEAQRQLLEQPGIDLLLTDVMMPGGISGPELARWALGKFPALRILFSSGYSRGNKAELDALGQQFGLLGKPYRRGELEAKVREALGRD